MANEPNRAEEELKRYAAERRAQAPTELHPADRRLLQGEVGRVYGGSKGAGEVWWKRVLLAPRFAWGVSLVAILGISFLALQQPAPRKEIEGARPLEDKRDQNLTQRREDVEAQREEKKEKDLAAVSADSVLTVAPATASAATPLPEPSAPTVAPPPLVAEPAGEARLRKMAEVPARVETTRAAAKAMAPPTQQNERYFLNSAPQEKNLEAAKRIEVLNRFKMQEAGQLLLVDDADGSRYSGLVVTQALGTNLFTVSGMNQTLKQPVVFRGQYFRVPSQQSQAPQQNQNLTRQTQVQDQLARDQVRVQGQAVVGTNNQVQVDAQSPAQ